MVVSVAAGPSPCPCARGDPEVLIATKLTKLTK